VVEYLLVRPHERALLAAATRDLRLLVMDELHVYRGRQGADVAMLLRRLRQRAGGGDLQPIGTSATLASEGSRDQRRAQIAAVASTLFGVPVPPANVVDETLRRVAAVPAPASTDELRQAVLTPPPGADAAAIVRHPLTAWVEEAFGLDQEDGRLVRRSPVTFADGLARLVRDSGLDETLCRERLQALLDAGNAARTESGDPVFAFRLHQFLSSGSSVYATIDPPEQRLLTMEGQYVAPAARSDGGGDDEPRRLYYPLAFCRECGQELYQVDRVRARDLDDAMPGDGTVAGEGERLRPRAPGFVDDDEVLGQPGYFTPERDELWPDESTDALPDHWTEMRKSGPRVKKNYAAHVPRRLWVRPDGAVSETPVEGAVEGWYQPTPLMLCLRCRAAYDLRDRSEFAKLSTLSQTGRSTATTLATTATVVAMRNEPGTDRDACKVMSFTDNVQDASLQAGHVNDFVQVVLLRGALVRALADRSVLHYEDLGTALFEVLALEPEMFMREPVPHGAAYDRARRVMVDLLQYRAFEDLRRAWRVAQPNLEQSGLLRIDYDGVEAVARDEHAWQGVPGFEEATPARREQVMRAFLDHLRGALAIDAACLDRDRFFKLRDQTVGNLRDPWALDEHEQPRQGVIALLPGVVADERDQRPTMSISTRTPIGRYLRSGRTWDRDEGLTPDELGDLVSGLIGALRGHVLTVVQRDGAPYGVAILAAALRWTRGEGRAPGPDPVRARSLHMRRGEAALTEPNRYFRSLYADRAGALAGLTSAEHTGKTRADLRSRREDDFRHGRLPVLVCSPTMELGIDIRDLSVVHMRNVPPTPDRYAQRSGRAGRGGKPALVLAFCSHGNSHDQHYFRHSTRMIAGTVVPPRMDLTNRELVEAHLHAVWLAEVGLSLGSSLTTLVDVTDVERLPLLADVVLQLTLSPARQHAVVAAFRTVVAGDPLLSGAHWMSEAWLTTTVREAPDRLAAALDRWRELYRAAVRQRDEVRRQLDRPGKTRRERQELERREREARREIDLLLNEGDSTETDFYPYRYFATEGFLPGYNFPRLPLRALVPGSDEPDIIDRPRFLGLRDFGPNNVIYHEGRKHRVFRCVLPVSGIEARFKAGAICRECGFIHVDARWTIDLCDNCSAHLDAERSDRTKRLLDQPTVRARRVTRITSEEEERSREGYKITTQVEAGSGEPVQRADVEAAPGDTAKGDQYLLEVNFLPSATVWRVNHGWRRTLNPQTGFAIDPQSGEWRGQSASNPCGASDDGSTTASPEVGVRPFVRDRRNVLLVRPLAAAPGKEAERTRFLHTLVVTLQRGIQVAYQVEEQEVAVELLGRGDQQRLLLWEAAEGGTGVWERILGDPGSLATIAREALRVCHTDPTTGEPDPAWDERCTAACYDCLLSFSNQGVHRQLDRRVVRDLLVRLSRSTVLRRGRDSRDYDEQYQWLLDRTDPKSTLERDFLAALHAERFRLPDDAQTRPENDLAVQPDFYYRRDGGRGVCVFVDGPHHDVAAQRDRDREIRDELEDRGYRVVVIRHDRELSEQARELADVVGT
jgi:hypothetical protein